MLSVVVPVFNEEATLPELHRRLADVLAGLGPYEVVLVDDGSTDASWAVLQSLGDSDPQLCLLRLSRNFGHQAAISAGLATARGDAVVTMDADLQDPPELIPKLVERWREGYEVVYKLMRRISGTDIPENAGDFRLLSRRVVDALQSMPERARYLRGMTSWVGFPQTGVPYRRDARFAGDSKYPPRKLVALAFDGLTSFSTVPIQLVAWLGFALVVFCVGVLSWTLYTRFFTDQAPQGWTSLLVVFLLLGGVQLLSLGIIGQYVARIFEEAKQRPLYFVSETRSSTRTAQAGDRAAGPSSGSA